jgi:hypothetical protein
MIYALHTWMPELNISFPLFWSQVTRSCHT